MKKTTTEGRRKRKGKGGSCPGRKNSILKKKNRRMEETEKTEVKDYRGKKKKNGETHVGNKAQGKREVQKEGENASKKKQTVEANEKAKKGKKNKEEK